MVTDFVRRMQEPISQGSLVFYRTSLGLLLLASVFRSLAYGWVDALYVAPTMHFPYAAFEGIRPLPAIGMYAVFVAMGVAAFFIAAGFHARKSLLAFTLLFTYVELIDKSNYLNHYYLVSILGLLLALVPLQKAWPWAREPRVAVGWLWILRLQVGLVYFFAGLAKLNPDWLFEAQPLKIWLAANADLPLIGPLLRLSELAYLASWTGAIFDLSVPFLLLWSRTRIWAFAVLVVFHIMTWFLFNIGLFPWMMIANASLFFPADWPHRVKLWWNKTAAPEVSVATAVNPSFPAWLLPILLFHFLIQLILPLRPWFHEGNFLWHEKDFRFGWKVMLMEKAGLTRFRVQYASGLEDWIYPREYLTLNQEKMMSTQADMIVYFAQRLRDLKSHANDPVVAVRVESFVSLNGRRSRVYVSETANLLDFTQWNANDLVTAGP